MLHKTHKPHMGVYTSLLAIESGGCYKEVQSFDMFKIK